MSKIKLDLHDIFNKSRSIESALNGALEEAIDKGIPLIEIIPGKGSGQLKKRVIRFFEQPEIKRKIHRLEKDSKNFGRVFIHLKKM
jgi:dsDNA-specific endonuclease/ATPase MutS2